MEPAACGEVPVEVGGELVAGDRHPHPDLDRFRADAVAVDEVREAPGAVRQGGDLGTGAPLGVLDDVAHVAVETVDAVVGGERQQVLLALLQGRHLRQQVAVHERRHAHVAADDPPHGVVALTGGDELERRQPQPLLVDLGVVAGVAAGHAAADVGVVGDHAQPGDEGAFGEHGLEQEDVGQVAGAGVGIVAGQDVPRPDVPLEHGQDAVQGGLHGSHVERQGQPLGHLLAGGVEHGGGEVHAVLDDGRAGGAHHGHRHAVGGGHQRAADDLAGDRVAGGGLLSHQSASRVMQP